MLKNLNIPQSRPTTNLNAAEALHGGSGSVHHLSQVCCVNITFHTLLHL